MTMLAGLAAAALAVAGCGSESDSGTSPASASATANAARKADAVCSDLARRRDAIQTLADGAARTAVTARAYAALAEVRVDRSEALERLSVPGDAPAAL